MKKEEMINETVKVISHLNRARTFIDFQFYLKGENFLLSYLFESGGESTPSTLAQQLDVSAARIAAIVKRLEIKKLITRKADTNDKRRISIKITQKGTEWVKAAQSQITQNAISLLDKLGEEDTKELVRILNKALNTQACCKNDEKNNDENQ